MRIAALAIALAVAVSTSGHAQSREPDRWLASDKVRHFAISGYAYSVSHAILQYARVDSPALTAGAAAGAVIAGFGKEFLDRRRGGRISARDLVWDGAGAVLAGLLMKHTRR